MWWIYAALVYLFVGVMFCLFFIRSSLRISRRQIEERRLLQQKRKTNDVLP